MGQQAAKAGAGVLACRPSAIVTRTPGASKSVKPSAPICHRPVLLLLLPAAVAGCAAVAAPDFTRWDAASETVGRVEVVVSGDHTNDMPAVDDSGHLVFQSDRGGNWDIWLVDLNAPVRSAVRQLTTSPEIDFAPSVSRRGDFYTFVSTRLGAVSPRIFLARFNSPAATEVAATEAPSVGSFEPAAINPDGSTLAYTSGRYIWLIDVHTGVRTQLVEGYSPTWDPASGRLIYRRKAKDFGRFVSTGIWSAAPDGSDQTEIVPGSEQETVMDPSVSPDGRRLCYTRKPIVNGRLGHFGWGDVFVARIDGTNPIQITTAPGIDGQCAWYGNDRLLFTSDRPVPGGGRKRHLAIWMVTLPQ
jgi:Tol biopolymer transport system component